MLHVFGNMLGSLWNISLDIFIFIKQLRHWSIFRVASCLTLLYFVGQFQWQFNLGWAIIIVHFNDFEKLNFCDFWNIAGHWIRSYRIQFIFMQKSLFLIKSRQENFWKRSNFAGFSDRKSSYLKLSLKCETPD